MRLRLLAFLCAVAVPAAAQVPVDPKAFEELMKRRAELAEKLAPAKIDNRAIDALTSRLMRDGEYNELLPGWCYEGPSFGDKSKNPPRLAVCLIGAQLPPREIGEPGSGFHDLGLRFSLKGMEAVSQTVVENKDGASDVEQWNYVLGLDGTLEAVTRTLLRLGPPGKDGDQAEISKRRIQMAPRDPAVLDRWKKLEPQLLKLGRTVEA